MREEGSAYLDRSGRVVVADASFRALLGTAGGDASAALRGRAQVDARLAAILAGEGPDRASIAAAGDLRGFEVTRILGQGGMLLRVSVECGSSSVPMSELAVQAVTLARLAGTVAHEVKNPLNAMSLQLALLGDKISSESETLSAACAGNLASVKNQIGRINEVVRRYAEIADAPASPGFDAGALVLEVTTLFGHEARRRRVPLSCDAAPGKVRAAADAGRATRLLLGLFWRAVLDVPPGEALLARVTAARGEAILSLEHPLGERDPSLAWIGAVVAEAATDMGGRLEESRADGVGRTALVLPEENRS